MLCQIISLSVSALGIEVCPKSEVEQQRPQSDQQSHLTSSSLRIVSLIIWRTCMRTQGFCCKSRTRPRCMSSRLASNQIKHGPMCLSNHCSDLVAKQDKRCKSPNCKSCGYSHSRCVSYANLAGGKFYNPDSMSCRTMPHQDHAIPIP